MDKVSQSVFQDNSGEASSSAVLSCAAALSPHQAHIRTRLQSAKNKSIWFCPSKEIACFSVVPYWQLFMGPILPSPGTRYRSLFWWKSPRSIMQEKVIEAVDSHLRILGGHWKLGNSRDVERGSGNYAAAFQWIPARGRGEPMFCMTRIRQGVMYNLCWYGNRRTTWTHHWKTPQWLSSMVTMSYSHLSFPKHPAESTFRLFQI